VIDRGCQQYQRWRNSGVKIGSRRKSDAVFNTAGPCKPAAELYNLLTLLKQGIFKTEKEFHGSYMASSKPRNRRRTQAGRQRGHYGSFFEP
jgi:hypothetical protein